MKPLFLEVCGFGPFRRTQTIDFSRLDNLFVISGETGSGKTTLFDAISYALYEQPLGTRSKKSIRCDLCEDSDSTWVRFRFQARGATWEIFRSPYLVVPKQRGSGTKVDTVTTLHRIDADQKTALASKPSDVTRTIIHDILHLSHEHFSKILVLPQGEFQKFLEEESKDRSLLLRKLFPVSLHEELVARSQEHARTLSQQTHDLKRQLDESRNRLLGVDRDPGRSNDEVHSDLDARAETLRATRDAHAHTEEQLRTAASEAHLAVEQARAIQDKLNRQKSATQKLHRLDLQTADIRLATDTLSAARRAARAVPALDRFADLDQRVNTGRGQVAATRTALDRAAEAHQAAAAELQRLPDVEARMAESQKTLTQLETRIPQLSKLADARQKRTQAAQAAAKAAAAVTQQTAAVEQLLQERAGFEGLETRMEAALRARDEAVAAVQTLDRLRETVEGVERFVTERLPARTVEQRADAAELARLEAQVTDAKGRLDIANARWKAADAARLAVLLVDGEPCPVCGGTDHPNPAQADGELHALEALVEAAQQAVQQAEAAVHKQGQVISSHLAKHEAHAAQAKAETARMTDAGFDTPDAWRTALTHAHAHRERTAATWTQVQQEQQESIRIQKALETARSALAELDRTQSEQNSAHAGQAARVAELEEALGPVEDVSAAIRSATERQTALQGSLGADRAHCAKVRDDEANASRLLAAKESQLSEQTQELQQNELARTTAEEALRAALNEHDFPGVAELQEARRSAEEEQRLADRIKIWDDERNQFQGILSELAKALDGVPAPDLPVLEAELRTAKEAAVGATEQRTRAETAISTFDTERTTHNAALQAHQEAAAASAGVLCLARVLAGTNGRNVKFPDWVLSWWLDRVLVQANSRLQVLSEGRYRLERRRGEVKRDKRKTHGLDLDIFDAHTGRPREVNTMSGGEKFLASVSLALGLADVIQMNSGAIELDTLFIDEGFGTLSDHYRDLVLEALDELGNSRQVGVISHVKEVKAYIPSQVQLHKSLEGSSVTLQA